jgi:DNA-binding NtrC family response regulator
LDVATRAFRHDLFYRLNTFTIQIPPLRERREDIPLMAARFLEAAARGLGKRIAGYSPEALELLNHADWPGNVRQLQNEIDQAVALANEGEVLGPQRFSRGLLTPANSDRGSGHIPNAAPIAAPAVSAVAEAEAAVTAASLAEARAKFETRYIAGVLERHRGNVSHAAVALGVSRVTLQKKMKEYLLR